MKKFAFVSRHVPTPEQNEIALIHGIELIPIGDLDGFTVTKEDIESIGQFDGLVVVHGGMAMNLKDDYIIGMFENELRPQEGGPATFKAKKLHIWWKKEKSIDLARTMNFRPD